MYNALEIEQEIQQFWKRINLLKLLQDQTKNGESYYLLDGPPYANNIPHVGNIRNTIYKDLFIRKAFMQQKNVHFQPGFDTHGLPVENMVEKQMGLKSKKDIQKLGVAKFVKHCRDMAAQNKELWMDVFGKLGSWYSYKQPWMTYDNSYVQSGWWAFKTMWDKGLIYEGKKPVYWCPHCETALAGYEVTDSYAMVSSPGIFFKFKLKEKDKSGEDQHLLVYTTTPWTLISNVAIAVHPDEPYVKVKTEHGLIILAEPRLKILDDFKIEYEVKETFKGKELDQKEYEPLLDVPAQQKLSQNDKAHKVYMSIQMMKNFVASKIATKKKVEEQEEEDSNFVTMSDGTGMVHTAPGHGKTDHDFGDHYGLPKVSPLDDQCKYTEDAGELYQGKFCKDMDKEIIKRLEAENKLVYHKTINHKYPLCWRCKSKLIFRLSDQWFIKVEPIKEQMLKANEQVNWQPEFARTRFHNWVAQAEDWNVSRQRYWGIPLPIWRTEDRSEVKVFGSLKELQEAADQPIPDDFDLHAASEIVLKSSKGEPMQRVIDIADVWYDSGVAPFASLGYPAQNKELFEKIFPVNRINEAQDQIRGWFYSLMFCGVGALGKAPYVNVSMPGWLLDARGDKMSKSVGNVAWAKDVLEDIGADMLRFYMLWDIAPYDTVKFNIEILKKEVGKFLNVIWNLHNLVMNAEFEQGVPVGDLKLIDRWVISRFHTTIKEFKQAIEDFEFHDAGRGMSEFMLNDVSRWYIQLSRERMDAQDKTPYKVLHHILLTVAKLLFPTTPHISEKIYQNFNDKFGGLKQSVHLEQWPNHDANLIDEDLEEQMEYVQKSVASLLSAREKAKLSVRWPVPEVIIVSHDARVRDAVKQLQEIIKTQVNTREVKVETTMDKMKVSVMPDAGKIGMDYKDRAQKVINVINQADANDLVKQLDESNQFAFELDGETHHIIRDYVKVDREVEGPYTMANFKIGHVYVNTTRSQELDAEGYAREIVRKVQSLRKKAGLEKHQDISLTLVCDKSLQEMLHAHQEAMAKKVGAKECVIDDKPRPSTPQWNETLKVKNYEIKIEFDVL